MRLPARWLVAAAVGWSGAGLLLAITGHLSLVLLFAPGAFVLGDWAAERRKARLRALVDAAFLQLVSDDDSRFSGMEVTVLRRRSRLLGAAATPDRHPDRPRAGRQPLGGQGRSARAFTRRHPLACDPTDRARGADRTRVIAVCAAAQI